MYEKIVSFCPMVRTQFDLLVQKVHSDNGSKFTNRPLQAYFRENGMLYKTSSVDTPQKNGHVEWKNRHILNVARALWFQASLPIEFWGKYVLATAYLINCTPAKLLEPKTPYEVLFGVKPNYDDIKVFGCLYYAHNHERNRDKFDARATRCVFLGYLYG